ncbi:uncharacterized protein LOC127009156 [Eriocheir sinensis]|uniref:uncharacterized protein LOC127009156 n=1 Tax=Eriocheir sinensis TaxID=95602 RepID=UPI0021C7CA9B|nr:uncharacterized protein LOC127009156 [Eriocheir sinensis]
MPSIRGHQGGADRDGVGLRVKNHCHSDCSNDCSSCYKMTRAGHPYGPRCLCIDKATPLPKPVMGEERKIYKVTKRYKALLVVLVLGFFAAPVVLNADIPNPAPCLGKGLHALWWTAQQITWAMLSALSFVFKALSWPWRFVWTGGKELPYLIPWPSGRDLLMPLRFAKGQAENLHYLNTYLLKKAVAGSEWLWRKRSYVKRSVQGVAGPAKDSLVIFRTVFRRTEKAAASAGKKGFIMQWKASKKIAKGFVLIGRRSFIIPWWMMRNIPKGFARGTKTAGKTGLTWSRRSSAKVKEVAVPVAKKSFILQWRLSKKLGKKSVSAAEKGSVISVWLGKLARTSIHAAGKSFNSSWRLGAKLVVGSTYVTKKGLAIAWRFFRNIPKTLAHETKTAGKKGFTLSKRSSGRVKEVSVPLAKKSIILPWRSSKYLGKKSVSAGKKGFTLSKRSSRKVKEVSAPLAKKSFILPWRFSKRLGKKSVSAAEKGSILPMWLGNLARTSIHAAGKGFSIPWRISKKGLTLIGSGARKGVVASWRVPKRIVESLALTGKNTVILPWKIFNKVSNKLSTGAEKGFSKSRRASKKLGEQSVSAGKKGLVLPWRFSKRTKKLGEKSASVVKKGLVMPWTLSKRGRKDLGSAAKEGFVMPFKAVSRLWGHGKAQPKKSVSPAQKAVLASSELLKKVFGGWVPPSYILIHILVVISVVNTLLTLAILVMLILEYAGVITVQEWQD